MNARIIKIFLSASLLIIFWTYNSNAQSIKLRGEIPFNFIVGDVLMDAGEYDISRINMNNGVFAVRSLDNHDTAVRLYALVQLKSLPDQTVLVFNRYIDNGGEITTFLCQVRIEGQREGYEFSKHRAEREAEKRMALRDIITVVVRINSNTTE